MDASTQPKTCLVLTRAPGEKIIVGTGDDSIEVIVVQVRGKHVRLAVVAPKGVRVDREEVARRRAM